MTRSVFTRLLVSFVLVPALGMAAVGFSLRPILDQALTRQTERSLAAQARLLAGQLDAEPNALPARIAKPGSAASGAQVSIFDDQGRLLTGFLLESQAPPGPFSHSSPIPPEIASILFQHRVIGRAERGDVLYVAVPATHRVVRLAYPIARIRSPWRRIVPALLAALILAALWAAALARRAARRLGRVVTFADRIASGDLSARIEECDLDEISAVARALNAAAGRMEGNFHALEGNRRELTALLDSMQEAVIAVGPQGHVSWCNAVMRRIALTAVHEGRALVHSIRDPEVLSAVDLAIADRQVHRGRATSVAPGKVFEVNAAPMPGGGAVAVLHDVSEIERSETTRRDFVANVSHELRTPLTCVMGYVETLLDDLTLNPQAREFLGIILKNAVRMNRLTEDLLALASVESGDYKLHLRPIPASALVEDAVTALLGLVLDSDLVLEAGETTGDAVMADPDALNQVFGNLVENAMKYGKSGGRIRVGSRRQGSSVEFYVQDFGSGIAYEHLSRIFERFYRVDKARSRESGGTGLGLAIAKHIVHAHGGDIRCESELGSGATFLFRLPALDAAPDGSSDEDRSAAPDSRSIVQMIEQ